VTISKVSAICHRSIGIFLAAWLFVPEAFVAEAGGTINNPAVQTDVTLPVVLACTVRGRWQNTRMVYVKNTTGNTVNGTVFYKSGGGNWRHKNIGALSPGEELLIDAILNNSDGRVPCSAYAFQ